MPTAEITHVTETKYKFDINYDVMDQVVYIDINTSKRSDTGIGFTEWNTVRSKICISDSLYKENKDKHPNWILNIDQNNVFRYYTLTDVADYQSGKMNRLKLWGKSIDILNSEYNVSGPILLLKWDGLNFYTTNNDKPIWRAFLIELSHKDDTIYNLEQIEKLLKANSNCINIKIDEYSTIYDVCFCYVPASYEEFLQINEIYKQNANLGYHLVKKYVINKLALI